MSGVLKIGKTRIVRHKKRRLLIILIIYTRLVTLVIARSTFCMVPFYFYQSSDYFICIPM